MNNKFLKTIDDYHMIQKGDTVAVCLSGGADSMALFHLLCVYKQELQIQLIAVHINHGLRTESQKEEEIVRAFCENHHIMCVVHKAHMQENQKPQGLSTEMWAREIRYEFFEKIAQKYNAKLATAHTLSDRSETILFNLTRGSNIKGAIGIPAVRNNIIRPLFHCTRQEIEDYCNFHQLPYVTDTSNFSTEYARNRIRLQVIPPLKTINPNVEAALGDFSDEMNDIYTFLTQLSDRLYNNSVSANGFDIKVLQQAEQVLVKIFLRNILEQYHCLSKNNIEIIFKGIKSGQLCQQLSKELKVEIQKGYLKFVSISAETHTQSQVVQPVIFENWIEFLSKNYYFQWITPQEYEKIKKNEKNYLNYFIDCDTMLCKLFLRTRKTGDLFTLQKRKVTKTVKKLLIEDKVPQNCRDTMAILSDENNQVLWLEGYGVNAKFAVTEKSKSILMIERK